MTSDRRILVCQNRTCRKQGSAAVLAAFQAHPITDVAVSAAMPQAIAPSGCLGKCGNGPMVLILPEMLWYSRVRPDDVPLLLERQRSPLA